MKKLLFLLLVLSMSVVGANSLWADTLNSGNTLATSQAFNPSGSFWNNTSGDVVNGSSAANVGNMLNATGSFATPVAFCPTCGVNYMASGGQMFVNSGNTPDFVGNLNFVTQTGGLQISLLYANSPENTLTSFGIFNTANTAQTVLLEPAGINLNNAIGGSYIFGTQFSGSTNLGSYDLSNGSPYADWGIFVTTCTEITTSQAQCQADGDLVTYHLGLNGQQFALFQSGTNVNQYYMGIEETPASVSGSGDYNDIILSINTSVPESGTGGPGGGGSGGGGTNMPEPGTFSMIGFGLAGIGMLRRRFAS